ncbi:E3 ubiquitin-protein ligase NEDD4 protein [Dioscorea alata]|uniref:E3 ubiquitin-protein ligase NEDD4 protein n=1 Tax=Dioscorea alata TaxID=55571 RepID=A0ACB7WMS1_DIOAL|nr:E3 ubiquitin-protein ligase NEDD4 protein [Dioscorea alata]
MSVSQPAPFAARRRSKRKLQDYEPQESMNPRCVSRSDLSLLRPFSASSSSPVLQFFVRVGSKTLVLHAQADTSIHSVIDQIGVLTRIPVPVLDVRLIHSGRQLELDRTLSSYNIGDDACLHLVARLRSTVHPRAWQLVNDLISAISRLNSIIPLSPIARHHYRSLVNSLVKEFLRCTPPDPDTCWGHLQVFAFSGAPEALVKLLISADDFNRSVADETIRLFLSSEPEYLMKHLHPHCARIVLEFCKLLAWAVGNMNPLYLACRGALGSLLKLLESKYFARIDSSKMVEELLPFLKETSGQVIEELTNMTTGAEQVDVSEFSDFMLVMRRAVRDLIGGKRCVSKEMLNVELPDYEKWLGALHSIFINLLEKVDHCLGKVGDLLSQKGPLHFDSKWGRFANLLCILTKLHAFSKIYEGGDELLHELLIARRAPVNELIKHAKKNQKLRWLLRHKDVTDFESRRNLVLMLFPGGKDDYDDLHEMLIDRSQLLAESFEYIGQAEATALHGGLFMEFKNEEATGPGVLREWFCLLCHAIFNPQNVLFLPCPNDRRRFFPNPTSVVDPLHLKYFGFCGRVIALALMHKVQVGILLDRVFFLQLAGKDVTLDDVRDADPYLYMSCKRILEMDAELLDSDILGLTFVREFEELGIHKSVELLPGGKDIAVNSRNRYEYVKRLVQHRFVTSISEPVTYFTQGFGDILSKQSYQKLLFESLDLEDFDRLLGGTDDVINVKDWKAHTEYNGYKAKDRQIIWFWKIVEGLPIDQQRVLLFFWTSVKYLPADGFRGLSSKLYIYKTVDSQDRLPTSHTCFYRLCLPPYPSLSIMRDRLHVITQEHVSCSFGFL